MKKLNLNGVWQMEGGGFNCQGNVPGSVYSFLLDNNLMPDPYFRDNELDALKLLENDFVFSRTFHAEKTNNQMLLHCDGLDTLCDIFINNQHIPLNILTTLAQCFTLLSFCKPKLSVMAWNTCAETAEDVWVPFIGS